jgi:hypothetical protein
LLVLLAAHLVQLSSQACLLVVELVLVRVGPRSILGIKSKLLGTSLRARWILASPGWLDLIYSKDWLARA